MADCFWNWQQTNKHISFCGCSVLAIFILNLVSSINIQDSSGKHQGGIQGLERDFGSTEKRPRSRALPCGICVRWAAGSCFGGASRPAEQYWPLPGGYFSGSQKIEGVWTSCNMDTIVQLFWIKHNSRMFSFLTVLEYRSPWNGVKWVVVSALWCAEQSTQFPFGLKPTELCGLAKLLLLS